MPVSNREDLEREVRETAKKFSGGADLPDLKSRIGEDLGITDDDFYLLIETLGQAHGVDLFSGLEVLPRRTVNPWSIASFVGALRQPGLIEDPSLERLVELLEQSGRKKGPS
jgi:hypothetical protein